LNGVGLNFPKGGSREIAQSQNRLQGKLAGVNDRPLVAYLGHRDLTAFTVGEQHDRISQKKFQSNIYALALIGRFLFDAPIESCALRSRISTTGHSGAVRPEHFAIVDASGRSSFLGSEILARISSRWWAACDPFDRSAGSIARPSQVEQRSDIVKREAKFVRAV
jgi:hypothetical protein